MNEPNCTEKSDNRFQIRSTFKMIKLHAQFPMAYIFKNFIPWKRNICVYNDKGERI